MTSDPHRDATAHISPLLIRLLDPQRRGDYALAFVIAAWPVGLSYLLGAHATHGGYVVGPEECPTN